MELRLKKTYFFEKDFDRKFKNLIKENALNLSKTQIYDITIRYYYYKMDIEKTVFTKFKEIKNSKDRLYQAIDNQVKIMQKALQNQNISYYRFSILGGKNCNELGDIVIAFENSKTQNTSNISSVISIAPDVDYTINILSKMTKKDFLDIYDKIPFEKLLAVIFGLPPKSDINKIYKEYAEKYWLGTKANDKRILDELQNNIEKLNKMIMENDILLSEEIKEFNENLMWKKIEKEFNEKYGRDSIFNKIR